MDGGWLKTEPADDGFSVTLERGIDVHANAQLLTIIKQDESIDMCTKSENPLDEIDPIQNSNAENEVKPKSQMSNKRKVSTAETDGEKAEKILRNKKLKQCGEAASKRVKKSYVCDECGREFKKAYGLSRHKLFHSGIKPFVCPEENCGAAFSQSYTLKSHQMSHTGERKFFCEGCGQGFFSKYHMQIHQRSKHSGERPYVCGECGQGFVQKQSLAKHLLEHSGNRPFECVECGMRFYERRLLSSHKKTHCADVKPFTCAECGKGFYHKTSLNAHQRTHSVIRPFSCEICGKRFTHNGTLNIHKVIHSDVRPFGCEECGLRFTQKFTLKTHRMKQHGLSTAPLKQQKTVLPTGISVIRAEPKVVSHNDQILRNGPDNTRSLETLEINGTASMDLPRKSTFPSNTNNLNEFKEGTFAAESGFEAQQPDRTIIIGKSSPISPSDSSYLENGFETNGDEESTEFEDKFAVDRSIDTLQAQSIDEISTSLDEIKEESTVICEPLFDIWKSDPTTSDDDYVIESERPIKQQTTIKNSNDESNERPFSCGKCERRFALVSALKNHQRSHRRTDKEKVKPSFICDECGKLFTGKQTLKIHKRIHSGSTPYSCKECGKSFNQLGNMKSHQLTHTGERPFACETCGLAFSKKETLQRHMRTHSEDKDFECDVCRRKFRLSSSLKRHKLSHTGERNYGCDICGKTFIDKTYIKVHLRTHTGEKPFACDQCPSRFIDKSQLKRHKGYCHREIGEPSPYRRLKQMKMMKMVGNSL